MNWSSIAQATSDILSILLIVRLVSLRLHNVYRIFCVFLIYDFSFSLIERMESIVRNPRFDYRITWISGTVIGWVLLLCMVYALLQEILAELPGILRFSRKLLNITFIAAIALSLITSRLDEVMARSNGYLAAVVSPIGRAVTIAFDLDRVISTVALLVLLVILAFVLWFPVQIPRNLVIFSIGLVVYFAANTALLLTRGLWSKQSYFLVSTVIAFVLSACYAYWTIFITRLGEARSVRIGHGWRAQEQERLVGQLETLNASLLRAARR